MSARKSTTNTATPIAPTISKVVYFDESSVTDYVQIIAGGQMQKTTELLKETGKSGSGEAAAEGSLGISKIFRTLIGLEGKLSVEANASISAKTQKMVQNILQNTILTDFLEIANNATHTNTIVTFEGYSIHVPKDSMSYYIMLSPYMNIINAKDGVKIDNSDMTLAIDRFDDTLRLAKGYFELVGVKDKEECIFRFNLQAFRNNYKITDLTKMNLVLFAVKVGEMEKGKLTLQAELELPTDTEEDVTNPSYEELSQKAEQQKGENIAGNPLPVYDVLLAGVVKQA